ncbi:MAG: hypothetical protein AAF564_10110 [Bacteroidota bacterium]
MNNEAQRYFFWIVVVGGLIFSLNATPAQAQYRSLGVGGMFGSPTGISLKKWFSRKTAYDAGVAWSLSKDPGIHLHSDLLIHRSDFDGMEEGRSYVYYGIGGRIKAAQDDPRAGVRIPIGFTFINPEEPIDTFIEIVPVLDILPRTRFAMNVSIGGRFYLAGNRSRY